MPTTSIYSPILYSDGSLRTDVLRAALDERGEVTFLGRFWGDLKLKSGNVLKGLGKNHSELVGKLLVDDSGGMVRRIQAEDFTLFGEMELAGVEYSPFSNIKIQSDSIGLLLTSRLDGEVWRKSRDLFFYSVEVNATGGVKLTKHPDDPATYGSNLNHFFGLRVYNYTDIGLDNDSGEGNTFYSPRCTSPNDGITCIRVNDDAVSLYSPNTDTNVVGKKGTTGILITSNATAALVMNPNGNGTEHRVVDNGASSTITRKDLVVE